MPWARDGSGLLVYRHRGRTVAQRFAFCGWRDEKSLRLLRWRKRGEHGGNATWARGKHGPDERKALAKYRRSLLWKRRHDV